MDATRFDTLARSLTSTGSRRRALTLALSGAAGIFGLTRADDAAAGGKCKPKCKECKKCKKGKNGRKGKCKPKPNETPCAGGSCQSGNCVAAGSPGCATGTRDCNGACIASSACCAHRECEHLSTQCRTGQCSASHQCGWVASGGSCIEDNADNCASAPFSCSCSAGACVQH